MTLWAVHIAGPDDLIAATDRADASAIAVAINTATGALLGTTASPLDPPIRATVVAWPWSPQRHAAALTRNNQEMT
jgi:hypothetical protein